MKSNSETFASHVNVTGRHGALESLSKLQDIQSNFLLYYSFFAICDSGFLSLACIWAAWGINY